MLQVSKDDNRQLQNIANALAAAKKIVVVTGAGISTNCGIPVLSYLPLRQAGLTAVTGFSLGGGTVLTHTVATRLCKLKEDACSSSEPPTPLSS